MTADDLGNRSTGSAGRNLARERVKHDKFQKQFNEIADTILRVHDGDEAAKLEFAEAIDKELLEPTIERSQRGRIRRDLARKEAIRSNQNSTHRGASRGRQTKEDVANSDRAGQNPFGVETKLNFVRPEQVDGVSDKFKGIIQDAAADLGLDNVRITSGHRTLEYNRSIGSGDGSRHIKGDATDIDVSQMDESERIDFIHALQNRGAKRFITYKNLPDIIHVDTGTAGISGGRKHHFMFDKTQDNLGKAPEWFQALAKEAGHDF